MSPIGEVLLNRLHELGMSRAALGRAMGYTNVAKALRRFDRLCALGSVHPDVIERARVALQLDTNAINTGLEATREQERIAQEAQRAAEIEAARARFRPHLRVVPERRVPSPIFVVALTGTARWLRQDLPDGITERPWERQLEVVARFARGHYRAKQASAGPFGAIQGYLYRIAFERAIRLDLDGVPLGEELGPIMDGKATLSVGGKALPAQSLIRSYDRRERSPREPPAHLERAP